MTRIMFAAAAVATMVGNGSLAQSQPSPKIQFVQVDRDVKLEVLDWGGTGRPLLLLAGNTRTAHDFTAFAPQLAATYHVYGIRPRFSARCVCSSRLCPLKHADDNGTVFTLSTCRSFALMSSKVARNLMWRRSEDMEVM